MKILFVIDTLVTGKAGASVASVRLMERLRARGHEVYVLSTDYDQPPYGVTLPIFEIPIARDLMRQMKIAFARPRGRTIADIVQDVDVVHVMFPFWLSMAAIKIGQTLAKPLVATAHVQPGNLWSSVHLAHPWLLARTYEFFMRRIYNQCQAVIAPSAFAEHELRQHGLRVPAKIISNGIPETIFRPMPPDRPAAWGDKFVILSVGRFSQEKMHHILIEAVHGSRYERDIQLVLVGEGPRAEALWWLTRDLTNPPIMGSVSQAELVRNYTSADLMVHLGDCELEGLAPMEARACGLPTLLSDSPQSAARQFALNDWWLVRRADARDLRAKIDTLVERRAEMPGLRAMFARNAGGLSLERSVDATEALYGEVVARMRQPPSRDTTFAHMIGAKR